MPLRSSLAFVLVEPRSPGNVGAAARALKNTGFRDLRLVNPPPLDDPEARKMAWRSLDVLDGAAVHARLADAVADCSALFAFTARPRRSLAPELSWEEALRAIPTAAEQGRVALLFGREDRGLEREELSGVRAIVRIPAAPERAVYNLSQAVLLVAFALAAAGGGLDAAPQAPADGDRPLPAGGRRHLVERLRDLLLRLRYDRHPDPGLLDRVLERADHLLERAAPTPADQAMLLGILKRIERELEARK